MCLECSRKRARQLPGVSATWTMHYRLVVTLVLGATLVAVCGQPREGDTIPELDPCRRGGPGGPICASPSSGSGPAPQLGTPSTVRVPAPVPPASPSPSPSPSPTTSAAAAVVGGATPVPAPVRLPVVLAPVPVPQPATLVVAPTPAPTPAPAPAPKQPVAAGAGPAPVVPVAAVATPLLPPVAVQPVVAAKSAQEYTDLLVKQMLTEDSSTNSDPSKRIGFLSTGSGGAGVCTLKVAPQDVTDPYGQHQQQQAASPIRFLQEGSLTPQQYDNCTAAFTLRGSAPRTLAVILVRWTRENYWRREVCCRGMSFMDPRYPGCDCTFGGEVRYDDIPAAYPPQMYERMFSDECDGKGSVNRAFYDMSGGRITFTNLEGDSSRVSVYGWATLPAQRTGPAGDCRDWCGLAREQLGVKTSAFQHIMCFGLWGPSGPALAQPGPNYVCDNACRGKPGPCLDTCPPDSGISTGCGCGTCYAAWGSQPNCNKPVDETQFTGFAVPLGKWPNTPWVSTTQGMKTYFMHELLHNLGFPHSGSLRCVATSVIERSPQLCGPSDDYGDWTSIMGRSAYYNVPIFNRLRHGWVSSDALMTVNGPGIDEVSLWAVNSRPLSRSDRRYQWWTSETLAIRIDLTDTTGGTVQGYRCPCNPGGRCPNCDSQAPDFNQCREPCCIDPDCVDGSARYYYVEYFRTLPYDYEPTKPPQVVVRWGDQLGAEGCPLTRLTPAWLNTSIPDPGARVRWVLDRVGQKFTDTSRGVEIEVLTWAGHRAVVRVTKS